MLHPEKPNRKRTDLFATSASLSIPTPPRGRANAVHLWLGVLMAAGASVNVSSFTSSPHGHPCRRTAPCSRRLVGLARVSLDAFFGPAIVVDVSCARKGNRGRGPGEDPVAAICRAAVAPDWQHHCELEHSPEDWPTLSEFCVRTLLGRGLRLLGVDAPSVDPRESKNLPVHTMLFSATLRSWRTWI